MKNKKTNEEKNAKKLAILEERKQKKAEKKAKREAKRAAKLEKQRAMIELKKQKRAEKKAKKLARIQKQKERKAALREKKRLAREKKRNAEKAMKLKLKAQAKKQKTIVKVDKTKKTDDLDAKTIISNLNKLIKNEAKVLSKLDGDELDKKIKKLEKTGYDVKFGPDGALYGIGYSFIADVKNNKKLKKTIDKPIEPEVIEQPNENNEDEPEVEMIPAGDLLGTDGKVNEAEVANVDDDDIIPTDDIEGDFEDEDDTIVDSRDETDIDLIESRREFFNNAVDFGEDIDN